MTKILVFAASFLAVALISRGFAQATDRTPVVPLQVIVDYPDGQQKRRTSRDNVVTSLGVAIGQQITITLQFPRTRGGDSIAIAPVDGGLVDVDQPVPISADGSVTFHFTAGMNPGSYRLLVAGKQSYEIRLYVFDPATARRGR
jgi:hypothetical protein